MIFPSISFDLLLIEQASCADAELIAATNSTTPTLRHHMISKEEEKGGRLLC